MKRIRHHFDIVFPTLACGIFLLWEISCQQTDHTGQGILEEKSIEEILEIVEELQHTEVDSALKLADTAYFRSIKLSDELQIGKSLFWKSLLIQRIQFEGIGTREAMECAKESHSIFLEMENDLWLARSKNLVGVIYYNYYGKDSIQYSRKFQREARKILEEDDELLDQNRGLLGEIYQDLGATFFEDDEGQALMCFVKSEDLFKESGNNEAIARLNLNKGELYFRKKDYVKAEAFFQESREFGEDHTDIAIMQLAYERLGKLKRELYTNKPNEKDYRSSIHWNLLLLQNLTESHFRAYKELGLLYHYDAYYAYSSTRYNDYKVSADSAFHYYKEAILSAVLEGNQDILQEITENVSSLCENDSANCKEAFHNWFPKLQGGSYQEILNNRLSEQNEIDKQLRSFLDQRKERERIEELWRIFWMILVLILLLCIVFLIVYQRIREQKHKAQLETYRAQINPHFVSNTINAIDSLVTRGMKEEISDALADFAELSRRILESSKITDNSLGNEVEFLTKYLSLLKLRFEDKLNYQINIEKGLVPDLVSVPAMIVQPFVENAVLHGINAKQGPGSVQVDFSKYGKFLRISIDDDGVGREEAASIKQKSLFNDQESLGSSITEERIRGISGSKGTVVSYLDKRDHEGNALGTKVILTIPYRTLKEN